VNDTQKEKNQEKKSARVGRRGCELIFRRTEGGGAGLGGKPDGDFKIRRCCVLKERGRRKSHISQSL